MKRHGPVLNLGPRDAVAWIALLVFAALLVSRFPFREIPGRLGNARNLLLSHDTVRVDATPFWFDPHYAAFIEAVRERTPRDATVALIAPKTVDLYVYCAAYELAPRRIVGEEEAGHARHVAVYGRAPRPDLPAGESIPGGTLISR
jgi:hypothetical protein